MPRRMLRKYQHRSWTDSKLSRTKEFSMTKSKASVAESKIKTARPYGDFACVKPLITPPKIRRERTQLIRLLADELQNYDACVRALGNGEISPSTLSDADYNLALSINQLCYFDEVECQLRGEYYDSQYSIGHYERAIKKAK